MSVLLSLHPCSYVLLSVFLIINILVGVKWYFIVILICVSRVTNDIKHLFFFLWDINMCSLEKCWLKIFAHISHCSLFKLGFLSCMVQLWVFNIFFLNYSIFKGYFPFAVMTKYWLYSLCCTINRSWAYLIPNSLFLSTSPLPAPLHWKPPVCSLSLWLFLFHYIH